MGIPPHEHPCPTVVCFPMVSSMSLFVFSQINKSLRPRPPWKTINWPLDKNLAAGGRAGPKVLSGDQFIISGGAKAVGFYTNLLKHIVKLYETIGKHRTERQGCSRGADR